MWPGGREYILSHGRSCGADYNWEHEELFPYNLSHHCFLTTLRSGGGFLMSESTESMGLNLVSVSDGCC